MKGKEKGGHEWFVEFKNSIPKNISIEQEIDNALKDENSDYEAKRYKDFTLNPPKVIIGFTSMPSCFMGKSRKVIPFCLIPLSSVRVKQKIQSAI
jgi:hypothetical protein